MSLEVAFETGRLYKPLRDIADARRDVHSTFTLLPGLRGFWPMSIVDAAGNAVDLTALGDLSAQGSPVYGYDIVPYVELDGTNDYLSHTDSALYDITGTEWPISAAIRGLTLGGWFRWNADEQTTAISKWNSSNWSYNLTRVAATDNIQLAISDDGSTGESVLSATNSAIVSKWLFIVGRFTPGSELAVFVNGNKATVATTIASVYNGSAPFVVGALDGGSSARMNGRASHCFLCAAALPDSLIDNLYQVSRQLFGV